MGFWSDTFRAINPFAKEVLDTPEKREKKAWKAAASLFYLQVRRHDYYNMTLIALRQAEKNMDKPGPHQKAWAQKFGFLKKYQYSLKFEERRHFRETNSLPQDIKQRAQWLVIHERAQFEQQFPPRNLHSFSSYSPDFIRKY